MLCHARISRAVSDGVNTQVIYTSEYRVCILTGLIDPQEIFKILTLPAKLILVDYTMASQSSSVKTTLPNTPISQHNLEDPRDDFARLTPSNALARLAFSAVVDKVLHDPDLYNHCKSFLAFERSRDDEGFSEASDVDDKVLKPIRPRRLWKGFYRFNLNILPLHPPVGWVLGCPSSNPRAEVPDLLLTSRKGMTPTCMLCAVVS